MNKIIQTQIFRIKIMVVLVVLMMPVANLYATGTTNSKNPIALLQNRNVTLNISNKPIKTILNEIYKQTKISFVFKNGENLSELSNISIQVKDKSVEAVLNQLLANTSFMYEIENNVVTIQKKKVINKTTSTKVLIKGKVVEKSSKKPIVGATILVAGKSIGAISDDRGFFSFIANSNDELEVSYIGRATLIYNKPLNSSELIVLEMENEVVGIDDVVVTGYGSVNRRDMVGVATTLKAEDILNPAKMNIADMLQGQVAGMIVTNSSSRVGSSPSIQIRGQSTLSDALGNRNPIWVVDGVIQDEPININASLSGFDDLKNLIGNQVSWLNPNDIESVTVLKDASATAIYGSRASNGVIVIVTKTPKDEKISISYVGSLTINSQPKYKNFDYMNSQERIQITEELYNAGLTYSRIPIKQMNTFDGLLRSYVERDITSEQYNKRRAELETMNTDWFDLLTRTDFSQNHNISLSGKVSDKLSVMGSLGYIKQNGQEIKNGADNFTARISLNAKLGKRVAINFAVNGSKSSTEGTTVAPGWAGGGSTPLEYAKGMSRSIPAYNEDGSPAYYLVQTSYKYNENAVLGYNFMNELNETSAKNISGRLGMSLNASLKFTEWLSYEFQGSYSYTESSREAFRSERSFSIADQFRGYSYNAVLPGSAEYNAALMPHGGTISEDRSTGNSYNIQNKLVFSKTINEKHRLNAMLANEIRSSRAQSMATAMWGFLPDRGNKFATPPRTITPITGNHSLDDDSFGILNELFSGKNVIGDHTTNFMSFFGTLAYSYDNRYVLNANVRNDVSNAFGKNTNNRFSPTYSFGLKWNITNESFMKDRLKWITSLSLSGTYGIQGNANLAASADLILSKGGLSSSYDEFGSGVSSIPNPYLTWERTSNWNFGLSGRFFDAVNVNIDYYARESNATVSSPIGFENGASSMSLNGGIITNEGIELTLSFNPVNNRNFGLNVSINSSKNWNKGGKTTLTQKELEVVNTYLGAQTTHIIKEGYPVGAFWSYALSHLDDENGSARFKYMDIDPAKAKLDPSSMMVYSGQSTPSFTGGINLNFRYRNVILSTSMALILGGKKRLPNPYSVIEANYSRIPSSQTNMSKALTKRWKKTGDEQVTFYPGILAGAPDNIALPGQNGEVASSINMWAQSDYMVVNSGFLRCGNMSLRYRFGDRLLKRTGISDLSIAGSVSNLFVIGSKRFEGFDPELANGIMPRNFSISLNIGF